MYKGLVGFVALNVDKYGTWTAGKTSKNRAARKSL